MSTHCLRKSQDAEIGFFIGKIGKYTWRDGTSNEVQSHLKKHIRGNPEIPVSIRNLTIKSEDAEADAVVIFVGRKDSETVMKALKEHPFPTCEIVLKSLKRGNPEEWSKRVAIHSRLSTESRTIKLRMASTEFKEKLREAANQDQKIDSKIIDFARVGFAGEELTLFVQCHKNDKDTLTRWIKQQILNIHPEGEGRPHIDEGDTNSQSTKTEQRSKNQGKALEITQRSKFDHVFGDDT